MSPILIGEWALWILFRLIRTRPSTQRWLAKVLDFKNLAYQSHLSSRIEGLFSGPAEGFVIWLEIPETEAR